MERRREEIEAAALTRVHSIADPVEATDPAYVDGLGLAVTAAIDYALAAIECSEEQAPPIPTVLLSQARLAARNGVPLETVMRRYLAGYTLLGDFLVGEGEGEVSLQSTLRVQASLFDRLLAAVSEEYNLEQPRRPASAEERRAELARRLLAGEQPDPAGLCYDLDVRHLGLVASGVEAPAVLRRLAAALDCRLLLVRRGESDFWAWLGSRRGPDPDRLEDLLRSGPSDSLWLALGEPGEGLAGWRLTHRQAAAAMPVALRGEGGLTRFRDVALLAAVLTDDLLAASLRELYLTPLAGEGGESLLETLRAYFTAERNISSAAAMLGISRQAAAKRLGTAERRLGRPLGACGIELEAALRLEELESAEVGSSQPGRG
ncbi:MAG TPA: helix-turn-helix domain-containing protein [Solirubrobacterales bacterium]|nr:helix-turn-helix domain-containing protein [Solirubrobacterales bacterium]